MAVCSTCLLTSGFTNDCKVKVPGGNYQVFYLIPKCQIDEIDVDVNGIVDTLTLDIVNNPGAYWFTVSANKDSVTTTEDLTPPVNFITQTAVFTISNIAQDADPVLGAQMATDFVNEIVNNIGGIVLLIKDRAGIWRLFGQENGLDVTVAQKLSGAVIADIAGTTLTLSGGEPELAPAVLQTVIDALDVTP